MIDQINKIIDPLRRRTMLMIGRAIIAAIKDDAPHQRAQVSLLAGESRDEVERLAEYGFTSVPLPGAQALSVFVGGERGAGVIIATGDHRYRLKELQPGEVALYTDEGDKIVLKRGKLIEIETNTLIVKAATKVRFESPRVETTADLIDQVSSGNARTVKGMRDQYNAHTHPGDSGGTTGTTGSGM